MGPKHDGLAEGGSPELLLLDLVSLASWCEREGDRQFSEIVKALTKCLQGEEAGRDKLLDILKGMPTNSTCRDLRGS